MNTSMSSTESARLPDYPFISPENRPQIPIEPLSTKREREEAKRKARDGAEERIYPREVRKKPFVHRLKRHDAPDDAHAIIFHAPLSTSHSFEESDSAHCTTDHECISVPIESEHYDKTNSATYFEQCFTVKSRLGEGSFGEVFEAKSLEDSKVYAVKRAIKPYSSSSDRAHKLSEVQKHIELTPHPNLVYFYRAWEERGRLYIQTELCTKSLADYCKSVPPPINEIWDIFYDVINAIDYVHSKDYIHLDIKPENIFLTEKKVCKLGDFGLMFDLKHDHMATVEEGDNKYLAPEVLNNPPTQAADIFSVGISILEVSTNLDLPTDGEHWHALRSRNVPENFLEMLDVDMRRLILWMIDPIPEARPTTKEIINDHAVYWPFLRRTSVAEMSQKISLASGRFSKWASMLWRAVTMPLHPRKRARIGGDHDETGSPDSKKPRIDLDSSCSDEEDTRHKRVATRSITHRDEARTSLGREYDENRERQEKQRLREERCISPTSFVSPSSPLFVHEGVAASAPMIGRRRTAASLARAERASPAPISFRFRLDSDSDDGEEKNKTKCSSNMHTPMSSSLSMSGRQFRRSALRTLDSPRARKLDFSHLDRSKEPIETEINRDDEVCRTPPPSHQQHRLDAGDA